jgi:hypothetical protein
MDFLNLEVKEVRSRAHRRGKSASSRLELEMDPVAVKLAAIEAQAQPGNLANFHTFKLDSPSEDDDRDPAASGEILTPSPAAGGARSEMYWTNKEATDDVAHAIEHIQKVLPKLHGNEEAQNELNVAIEILRKVQSRNIEHQVQNLERKAMVEMLSSSSKNSSMTKAELVAEWVSQSKI